VGRDTTDGGLDHAVARWGIAVELFDTSATAWPRLAEPVVRGGALLDKLGEKVTARFEHQQTVSGPANDHHERGIEYQALPSLALEVLASDGTRGSSRRPAPSGRRESRAST
jgi:hypothetical protein